MRYEFYQQNEITMTRKLLVQWVRIIVVRIRVLLFLAEQLPAQ